MSSSAPPVARLGRWRRWKKSLWFLGIESAVFVVFFAVVAADMLDRPETTVKAFVWDCWQYQSIADQYLAPDMRAGAFGQELAWMLHARPPQQIPPDDQGPKVNEKGALANGAVRVDIDIADAENRPFEIPLVLFRQRDGRWQIVRPFDYRAGEEYFQGAYASYMNHDPHHAIPEFRKSLLLHPANVQAHNYLGLALLEDGQPYPATAEFRTAVRLAPNDFYAHKFLARSLLQWGGYPNRTEAAREYQNAYNLNHQDAESYNGCGQPCWPRYSPSYNSNTSQFNRRTSPPRR